jgi:hypothetical protein
MRYACNALAFGRIEFAHELIRLGASTDRTLNIASSVGEIGLVRSLLDHQAETPI